jgi:uncharacterized protein DUF2380
LHVNHRPASAARLAASILATALLSSAACAQSYAEKPLLAVGEFGFVDTSGEPRDQRQQHEARLAAFGAALRSDLANQYRVIRFACESRPCNEDAAAVLTQARISGARYLLVGAVHKMSTLVGWAKAQIIDLRDDKVAFERLLSFRGDDDEAWRRAEQFLVDQIESSDFSSRSQPAR